MKETVLVIAGIDDVDFRDPNSQEIVRRILRRIRGIIEGGGMVLSLPAEVDLE